MNPDPPSRQGSDRPMAAVREVLPRLTRLSNAITRGGIAERAVKAAGHALDRPAVGVLVTLHLADGPLRVGEIAERMQVVGPHVTRQVQALERHGLVRRVSDPRDRRASLIEPTAEGAGAAERYVTAMIGWFTEVVSGWPEQDRKDLGRLLGRLADDVTAHLARLEGTPPHPH